jgi:hypothetical protein
MKCITAETSALAAAAAALFPKHNSRKENTKHIHKFLLRKKPRKREGGDSAFLFSLFMYDDDDDSFL